MKVTVKSIPVIYNGDRYLKGDKVEINQKYFDKNLFDEVKEEPAKKKVEK